MSCIINLFKTQTLFIKLKEYEDVFSMKKVNKLSLHKDHDHAIETTTKLSYELLYNLLNIKLTILKQYLNNVLMKK